MNEVWEDWRLKWSRVKWRSQGKSGVKSRSGGKARMKSSQEWSQEVKMNRRIKELKKPRNEWRIEEAKNEELKKWRMNEEWMKN